MNWRIPAAHIRAEDRISCARNLVGCLDPREKVIIFGGRISQADELYRLLQADYPDITSISQKLPKTPATRKITGSVKNFKKRAKPALYSESFSEPFIIVKLSIFLKASSLSLLQSMIILTISIIVLNSSLVIFRNTSTCYFSASTSSSVNPIHSSKINRFVIEYSQNMFYSKC